MATGQYPTIIDVASRMGSDGKPLFVAEMLSQCNEILPDAPWIAGNEMAAHEFSFRESIPQGSWVGYNQGSPFGKSTTGKARVDLATLVQLSIVDDNLARDSGDIAAFRESEDIAIMEGLSQTWAETLIYGNTVANRAQFMGLAPFYNTRSTSTALNASNVIDGGGRGTSNTSAWLIGWREGTFYMAFPRGWREGLQMEDQGDVVPGFDNAGNEFKAWRTYFRWRGGLVPQDWRNAVRIANLDTTAAGLQGPNAPDLFAMLIQAMRLFPAAGRAQSGITMTDAPRDASMGVRICIYGNRTFLHYLDIQSIRGRNVLLSSTDYAGQPCDVFRRLPIRTVDQIVNSESAI
jgi:hypothetical protein